jgi:hypothetical protein
MSAPKEAAKGPAKKVPAAKDGKGVPPKKGPLPAKAPALDEQVGEGWVAPVEALTTAFVPGFEGATGLLPSLLVGWLVLVLALAFPQGSGRGQSSFVCLNSWRRPRRMS